MDNLEIFLSELSSSECSLVHCSPEVAIRSLSSDTRKLKPGDWFICLKGESSDGHDFIEAALEKGAEGIIYDENRNLSYRGLSVKNTNLFLGYLANFWRKKTGPLVIAITGSNGKTSTKEISAFILEQIFPGKICKTKENFNNQFGVPFTLLDLKKGDRFCVVEMGTNHPGEIKYLAEIAEPDYSIVTTIAQGHIGNFGSLEKIAEEKSDILTGMKGGSLIINQEISCYSLFESKSNSYNVTLSTIEPAKSMEHIVTEQGTRFVYENRNFLLPLKGEHQWKNFLLVKGLIDLLKIEKEKVIKAFEKLSELQEIKGRMQHHFLKGIHIWDDSYNANPDSFEKAIRFLRGSVNEGHLLGAFGAMGELGEMEIFFHEELGRLANQSGFEYVLFCSPSIDVRNAFQKGFLTGRNSEKIILCSSDDIELKKGVEIIKNKVKEGDHLLIKGSRSAHMERVLKYWPIK